MADDPPAAASALMRFITDVLTAVDQGTTARTRFCEAASASFGCPAVGHVWILPHAHAWSVHLWRRSSEGARTATACELDGGLAAEPVDSWWFRSRCRASVLEWLALPYASEEFLPDGPGSRSVLVVGDDQPLPPQDARTRSLVLSEVALMERLVVRIEPPALPRAMTEGTALSPREVEVLGLLADGLPARAIAHRLHLSERTVHKHLGSIYRKLGVHDRLLAVTHGQALGLITDGSATAQVDVPPARDP